MTSAPAVATLPAAMVAAIVDQARAEAPNEACGLVIGSAPAAEGGTALRYVACRNELASPTRYVVAAEDLLRHTMDTADAGEVFWGIVHSHVRTAAVPSPTDLDRATYPDALYLVVSLADPEPVLRAWHIADGEAAEVPLAVVP
jgi:proteasome lid subunit RPN8/RPN11